MLASRLRSATGLSQLISRASTQSALAVTSANVVETTSGVKACMTQSKVTDVTLSQHFKKNIVDVSLAVKAGTRFESDAAQELGISQGLKTFSLLTNEGATVVRGMGSLEVLGVDYSVTVTRELIIYKLSCEKENLEHALPFVTTALTKPKFSPWELKGVKHQLKLDSFLFREDPVAMTVDLLHRAAFRSGLGNSLTLTDEQTNAITTDKLLSYHASKFTPSNTFLVTNNVPVDLIESNFKYFGKEESGTGLVKSEKTEFVSDEIRNDDNTKDSVVVAIARKSGPTNSKEAVVDAILSSLLPGKATHGFGQIDFLDLPLADESDEWVKAFQCDYSDIGLFGFLLSCEAENAETLINKLMESLKTLESKLTDDHVQIAKSHHMRDLLTYLSTPAAQAEYTASQMLLGTSIGQEEYSSILSSVTKADLKKAISTFLTGPKSMAANGNCSHVPYLDEIKA